MEEVSVEIWPTQTLKYSNITKIFDLGKKLKRNRMNFLKRRLGHQFLALRAVNLAIDPPRPKSYKWPPEKFRKVKVGWESITCNPYSNLLSYFTHTPLWHSCRKICFRRQLTKVVPSKLIGHFSLSSFSGSISKSSPFLIRWYYLCSSFESRIFYFLYHHKIWRGVGA